PVRLLLGRPGIRASWTAGPRRAIWKARLSASGPVGLSLASRRGGPTVAVTLAQLVRALDCGSRGCGFDSHRSPHTRIDVSAPVAQVDRALASEAKGQRFESSRAHHLESFALQGLAGRSLSW